MSESYLFGQFVNRALHYKPQGAITLNTSLKHFKKHKNNSAIRSDFRDRGSVLMRLSAGCGGWGGLGAPLGPGAGLWSHAGGAGCVPWGPRGPPALLEAAVSVPAPGWTRQVPLPWPHPGERRSRVMSLSVEVLFKVSTMRSSTPVRPHAPCLRQSSQKNQYHYGSQCTTQLCPQIKTPSVSATLLSRVWDSLGCVDALGVRRPWG